MGTYEKLLGFARRTPFHLLLTLAGLGLGLVATWGRVPTSFATLGDVRPNLFLLGYSTVLVAAGIAAYRFGPSKQGASTTIGKLSGDGSSISVPDGLDIRRDVERFRDAAKSLIADSSSLVKRDLSVRLKFVPATEADLFDLKVNCAYRVINAGKVPSQFPVRCQFDSMGRRGATTGHLRVFDNEGAKLFDKTLNFLSVQRNQNIVYMTEEFVNIKPGSWINIEWEATTKVTLPYTEFWATAHPLISMALCVSAPNSEFEVSADCYRGGAHAFERERRDDGHYFSAAGVLLPYQGVLVRVVKAAVAQQENRVAS